MQVVIERSFVMDQPAVHRCEDCKKNTRNIHSFPIVLDVFTPTTGVCVLWRERRYGQWSKCFQPFTMITSHYDVKLQCSFWVQPLTVARGNNCEHKQIKYRKWQIHKTGESFKLLYDPKPVSTSISNHVIFCPPPPHKEKTLHPLCSILTMCPVERREIIDSKVHGGGVYRLKINPCDKCRNDFCINYRLDHKSTGGQRQSLNSFLPSSILLHVFLPSFLQFFLLFLLLPRLLFSPSSSFFSLVFFSFVFFSFSFRFQHYSKFKHK